MTERLGVSLSFTVLAAGMVAVGLVNILIIYYINKKERKVALYMKFEVVGIDCPCVDLAVNVDVYPDSNGAEQIQNISWQGGGKVATGIVAAARLGAKGACLRCRGR